MKKIFLALLALALGATPAGAAQKKPLVMVGSTAGQLQAGDTILVNASATGGASINVPHGTAPASPVNGDLWTTTNGVYARINSATVGPLAGLSTAQTWSARQKLEASLSGALASNFSYLFNPQLLGVWASGDNQSSTDAGTNIPTLVSVEHYFGGSAVNSGRNALGVALHMTAPTSASNTYRFYAAGDFLFDSAFNDNGTNIAAQGYGYGIGGVCRLQSGATYWKSCIANDAEISVEAGASVQIKAVYAALGWPADAVQGTQVDTMFWGSAASTAVGFTNFFQIDDSGGKFPVTTSGTILKATGAGTPTISQGIDLRGVHVANFMLVGDGVISTTNSAASTSPTTGAARVTGGLGVGGNAFFGGVTVPPTYTIGTLPTCNSGLKGARASVSNGETTPTFLGVVSTTGAVTAPVFCNGTAWVYG